MPSSLERPLGAASARQRRLRGILVRFGALTAGVLLIALLLSRIDLTHDLSRMHVAVLSGEPDGHYHAVVARMKDLAAERHGVIREVASTGSVENVQRLRAAAKTCDVQFALAQDGAEPDGLSAPIAVYGRFARREAVLFLGKDADRLHEFADLRGMRIGVGPVGSGTERIARQIFALPDFADLGVALSPHPLDEQVGLLASGDLDLGVFVLQDDAPLVVDAITRRGLQIASFAHTAGIAKRLPHLTSGHVYAGIYDAVRVVPATDKDVLRVETLLVGNGCAGRTQSVDLLTVVAREFPDFMRHNKDTENTSSLPIAPVAKEFFDNGGPQIADLYVPWLVDVMPPANWAYVVMGVSLLFNAMGAGHRFRLWRIDAARVQLEERLVALFGKGVTLGDIQQAAPPVDAKASDRTVLEGVRQLVTDFEELAARSRRQSLSMLVPMGQEMAYRYQESVIYESLTVLRSFLRRS
jgi:hypothetical protein